MDWTLPPALQELMKELPDYVCTVPDEVTSHAFRTSGFEPKDRLCTRLVSLAAQQFVAEILEEAMAIHKRRKQAPAAHQRIEGTSREKRAVLTTEDLAEALQQQGIKVQPAPYYAGTSANNK